MTLTVDCLIHTKVDSSSAFGCWTVCSARLVGSQVEHVQNLQKILSMGDCESERREPRLRLKGPPIAMNNESDGIVPECAFFIEYNLFIGYFMSH